MTDDRNAANGTGLSPRMYPQWVVWAYEEREGKPTKVPYDPKQPKRRASATDPSTWADLPTARRAQRNNPSTFDGIGFVFTDNDPFCGIDLDSKKDESGNIITPCVDPITGEFEEWVLEVLDSFDSYSELSPSGTGVHILIQGKLPEGAKHKDPSNRIEVYDSGRYFTVSGEHLEDWPKEINPRQEALDTLYETYFPAPKVEEPRAAGPVHTEESILEDEALIDLAESASNAASFRAVWQGDDSEYGGDESRADAALVRMIAFYAQGDKEQVERVFSMSERAKREKWWKREDYRRRTINNVVDSMTEFYNPQFSSSKGSPEAKPEKKENDASRNDTRPANPARKPVAELFPIHAMPKACQHLVTEAVQALGCASELITLPMLAALSAAIGASRTGYVKRGWEETATLFLAVVASPGSMKSPAAKVALKPVYKKQDEYKNVYLAKKAEHERDLREYEVEKKDAAKEGRAAPPPPLAPAMQRSIASDTTVEALVGILEENPRGLIVHRDELTGWVRSMDQYKGGKGSDRQHWLSVWDAQPLVVDRKSRDREPIILNRPFVSVFGGIQPAMLGELGQAMEDGLMDRFLFGYPQVGVIRFKWAEISVEAEKAYANLYNRLASLAMIKEDEDLRPKQVPFSFEAKRIFSDLINALNEETAEPGFPARLEGVWAKMRGYMVRLALLMCLCRCAEENVKAEDEEISATDLLKANALLDYFKHHAMRVYAELREADPLDVFSGEMKIFLEEQEEQTWEGTAQVLLDLLNERGADGVPANATHLVKRITAATQRSPDLVMERLTRKNSERPILLKLLSDAPPSPDDLQDTG